MNTSLDLDVVRLSGYLHGMSELSGDIREYLASAYWIARDDPQKSVADLIMEYYAKRTKLDFSSVTELPGKTGELEAELCGYLAVDVLGTTTIVSDEVVGDRKKYLSFRVMDMLNPIRGRLGVCRAVFKLHRYATESKTSCTYFGLQFDSAVVVLQFNKMFYDE